MTVCLLISEYGVADKMLLVFFSIVTLAFDAICILQLMDYNPFYLFPKGFSYSGANVDYSGVFIGTIGNVDFVGAFFSIAIPLYVLSILKLKIKNRFYLFIPLLLTVYVLFQIKVYAGIVGLAGIIISLPFMFDVSKKIRLWMVCVLIAVFVMAVAVLYVTEPKELFLYQIHEILRGNINGEFGTYRIMIWEKVLNLVPNAPVLGHGPDTMIFGDFGEYGEVDPSSGVYYSYIDTAHNEFLNVLYHQGILGLGMYIGAVAHTIADFIKNGGKNANVAILGTTVISYLIQSFFGISMCITAIYFWIVWGLFIHEIGKQKNVIYISRIISFIHRGNYLMHLKCKGSK